MILVVNTFLPLIEVSLLALYVLMLAGTVVQILLNTNSSSKTLAYILLIIVVPLFGMFFYYSFGVNYRHKRLKKESGIEYQKLTQEFTNHTNDETQKILENNQSILGKHRDLIEFVKELGGEKVSANIYKLLTNGEEKFPEVLKTLESAEHFIHMEYYNWENDIRGNQIKDVLLEKISEGVKVRILYDAYASRKIKRKIAKELKTAGAEIYPVIKIKLTAFANRLNHRDHRKLIVVDGHTGFLGGINISDRYDNSINTRLWWRDTHIKIMGETVHNIHRHFLVNWNVAQSNKLPISKALFPDIVSGSKTNKLEFAQIVAGGPIYPMSNIMLTYFKIFSSAQEKLYITNPYFIPNESILNALKQAAVSGVDVRILLPAKSDSAIVGAASKFYYEQLLEAGVKIYLYKKGFVHAKTVIADSNLSIVGSANMDIRSFDLNFEIMSIVYGCKFALDLEGEFLKDLKFSEEIIFEEWVAQRKILKLTFAGARLISSLL